MSEEILRELLDRSQLSDLMNRYALGLDTRNWELWRSCFVDDLEADFTSIWPGLVVHGADEWVKQGSSLIEGLDATQHIITNHAHEISGDRAKTVAYLHAQHVFKNDLGADHNVLAGYYEFHSVRSEDGWRIQKYGLTVTWATGNGAVWDLAAKRMAGP